MDLYILRHGEAIEQSYEDASRPLSSVGKEQSLTVAEALKSLKVSLDAIVSSTLERSIQSAKIVQKELNVSQFTTTEHLVPGSDHLKLIKQLNEMPHSSLLLVGHEPHLSTLISLLVNGKTYSRIEIKKGSLARVEASSPIEKGKGTLKWLLSLDLLGKIS